MPLSLLNILKRPLRVSGRKALAMSRSPITTAPTGDDRLGRLIDVVGQLAQQQKSLLESLRTSPPAPSSGTSTAIAASTGTAPSPLGSAADIRAFVADMFRQHSTAAAQTVARDGYIRQHLADLPEAYRRLMPDTADAASLADAEQKIRQQFRDDLRSVRQGGRVAKFRPADSSLPDAGFDSRADIAGDELGGQPPAAAIDYDKLSPMQQIALGLKGSPATARPAVDPRSRRDSGKAGEDARAPGADMLDGEPLFVGAD